MWFFLLLFTFPAINGFSMVQVKIITDCKRLCEEKEIPEELNPVDLTYIICGIGCQCMGTANLYSGRLDIRSDLKYCKNMCKNNEYNFQELQVCFIGCDRMASKLQNDIQKNLIMTPQERKRVLSQGYVDPHDMDVLPDPSIRSQLEVGINGDYKIPVTHIRTMPIEEKDQQVKVTKTTDWLDCASKNSGIPRWILVSTMLAAIMVAIWLTLSMESRKGHEENDDELLVDIPDEKVIKTALNEDFVDPNASPEDVVDIKFLPPPTYSEITEVDNSELPNYSEAVKDQNREEDA